jgi:hypothetical protein
MIKTLAAGAALALFAIAGSAQAAPSSAMAGPKQPIPYAKLDSYLKASPRARANTDWWAGSDMASTGMSADTSTTVTSTETTGPGTAASMDGQRTPSAGSPASSVDNASGASQFQGATASTTTTGATAGQPAPTPDRK